MRRAASCRVNDEVTVRFHQEGDPSASHKVLFLPGVNAGRGSFEPQVRALVGRGGFCCVSMDNRGFGDSSKPSGMFKYSTDAMASDVESVLAQLGWVDAVSLVGWSMGGMVSLKLAARHPGRFKLVVAIAVTNGGTQVCREFFPWLTPSMPMPKLAPCAAALPSHR